MSRCTLRRVIHKTYEDDIVACKTAFLWRADPGTTRGFSERASYRPCKRYIQLNSPHGAWSCRKESLGTVIVKPRFQRDLLQGNEEQLSMLICAERDGTVKTMGLGQTSSIQLTSAQFCSFRLQFYAITEQNWNELSWAELSWAELSWIELSRTKWDRKRAEQSRAEAESNQIEQNRETESNPAKDQRGAEEIEARLETEARRNRRRTTETTERVRCETLRLSWEPTVGSWK
jgi:hypothetical protein